MKECAALGGCRTGEAKITKGYNLPAKHVIHTVGLIWHGGNHDEEKLLANAYANSLKVAAENGLETIAFPAISTGVYGFPKDRAAEIAVETIKGFLEDHDMEVTLVAFSDSDAKRYEALLAK